MPAEIRKKLGVGPGSVLEWDDQNGEVVVRRAGRYSSEEVSQALFASPAPAVTATGVKEGIRQYIRKRHARN